MRYIITGGAGFTGAYLCRALAAAGERPVVFDVRQPTSDVAPLVACVEGDIRSAEHLSRLNLAPGDVVFHLAARQFHSDVPHKNRDAWFTQINVGGTKAIVDAMEKGGATDIVFFSTDMTYGRPVKSPVSPDHPQNPIGPYGRSKRQAEQILIAARAQRGIRSTIFRPRLISGAGRMGILVKLFKLVRMSAPVPMIGSGHNRYQMIAVEDCVKAALQAVALGCPPGPFNLGSDDPPTVRELLEELVHRAGSRSPLVPTPARAVQFVLKVLDSLGAPLLYPEQFAIADCDYVLDTSATKTALNWSPVRRDADIIYEAYRQCWSE
jgi:dTDP-glucose 4,6-dehydratase